MMILGDGWTYEKREPTEADVYGQFAIDPPAGVKILLAIYDMGSYCGDAFVLFERDGKLYEVNASHCSCYGIENQWAPEEVVLEELEKRPALKVNYDAGTDHIGALQRVIAEWRAR